MNDAITHALMIDPLHQKSTTHFPGSMLPKDLLRQTKPGFNVPVYVPAYLLGNYCSSTDPEIIHQAWSTFENAYRRFFHTLRNKRGPVVQSKPGSVSTVCVRTIR